MRRRPNIVLLTADQLSWNVRSGAGNRYVSTPAMDRIAGRGVTFQRAYASDPVCAPQRTSWMTGRYGSETGTPFNGGRLHPDIADLGAVLREGGYSTFHAGKWHVDGRPAATSFDVIFGGQREIAAGGAEIHDATIARTTAGFLASGALPEPFYLQAHFVNPHDVCEYLHRFESRNMPDLVAQEIVAEAELPPLPDNFDFDIAQETVAQIAARRVPGCYIHDGIRAAVAGWSELDWRTYIWRYYRYVEDVDRNIGLVLDALESSGVADDTILIFTADHGESCASHHMFQKFTLYDESARVPFVVSSLGSVALPRAGEVEDGVLVSAVDLFSTICDYAGVARPAGTHGMSLRGSVDSAGTAGREWAYMEVNFLGRGIVDSRFKYITEYVPEPERAALPPNGQRNVQGREQLYDLLQDPGETVNLAYDPQHSGIVVRMRQRLRETEARMSQRPLGDPGAIATAAEWSRQTLEQWRALVPRDAK
ncbi:MULTISPECIES: sulfatase-like hydrolase/transferase [unclassified Devosia]|uniref:sulfatase family protein n=1 Tax=unclassified Devosia TaxID=196773 RepID=UPI001AC61A96|nr:MULTISPECIES: sulfatase-like hydrolase/transferase [unclassified Devosia]MBN9307497.1 sulfatase-like hydrolase/transferase [Devosia sp.]